MVLSHCDTASGMGSHFTFGRTVCHAPNFPTVCLTRLVWLIATAKSSVYYASLAAKNRPSSASSHQYCRSPGQSWRRCSRIFTALFRDLERVHVVSKKSEHTSLPGFCLSLRAATTVVVSHEGFYAAAEPYPALQGSTSRMNTTFCPLFSPSRVLKDLTRGAMMHNTMGNRKMSTEK